MPNRIIKESIRTSKSVNALSDFEFRVWLYLITYVDDYGRGSADPELLKGLVFPRRKGITEKQIQTALDNLANTGMVNLYEVDGESYFYFPNWGKHQRIQNKHPKFPDPQENDNSRKLTVNHGDSPPESNPTIIQSNPNLESNPKSDTRTHAKNGFVPPTVEEVAAYCRERGNNVDPQKFWDYFDAGDWHDSEGKPVKSWKQKLLTWEKHEGGKKNGTSETGRNAETSREEKRSKYAGFKYD